MVAGMISRDDQYDTDYDCDDDDNDSKSGDGSDGVETTDDGREKEQHDADNVDEYHDGEDEGCETPSSYKTSPSRKPWASGGQ